MKIVLIAAIALWFVGVETKGRTLEEITGSTARPDHTGRIA